ncbi:uncharacterized protein LOC125419005 [Ziziphus jujuba]|uniref:Uncharacterized protein LOC125419005 n=2 Tax=Ziziphus jujuba TaxID=326968 RepID=A0ABM4ABS2_ZIZJJ|nr:uncharacterized protein LOC125419005 [Ziziphus jujuba]XP_048319748.1 uncharacterized protein LOC125419005 [Ziziphus jujuba]XP_048319749.1 uncharacterized protein LOC125419005 [Ziziphus jujuba var. spinosa]XP_048319750.1 uncharacterized protein LOC125419005 [Ziziphus jujuba]XP_060674176.1 uncharacterized protein LOC125419005 [Ziziphus jujuba]KAH7514107.1 hypothetical protein FEM48_Zijuj11G0053600 [Ziziphus jujuba var. spinosa]
MDEFSIQISRNLVNRLADDSEKSKKKKRTKIKVPREPQRPQTKITQKQAFDDSETQKGATATGWPLQSPLFLPAPAQNANAELDAIRSLIQDSERVLERLHKQEENMVQEVTQRAKDLRDKEFKLPYQKPMPCLAETEACLACYQEHVKDPLKCAHLVRNFADCARRVRQQVNSA